MSAVTTTATTRYPRAAQLLAAAMLTALLAACAGQGVKQAPAGTVVPAADALAREAARLERVRAQGDWSLTGRVAVSNAGKGGSGRMEWSQRDGRFDVALSAPVTRQSWRLSGGREGARLEGLDGGPREGADAGELLLQATGWDIPVSALADWLRGLPARDAPAAKVVPGADGRPQSIEQNGWTIAYQWPASGDLPSRLDARRDSARVRLIVDEWKGATAGIAADTAPPSVR
ncbi:outer membrane lipoprotein LolB [Lysobacter gummosus]|nr:outer membrane lipoprotein LolB [Lysobacter gummosus]